MIIIIVIWLIGITTATFWLLRQKESNSSELVNTIITQNTSVPIEDVIKWGKKEKPNIDYKGMLK